MYILGEQKHFGLATKRKQCRACETFLNWQAGEYGKKKSFKYPGPKPFSF